MSHRVIFRAYPKRFRYGCGRCAAFVIVIISLSGISACNKPVRALKSTKRQTMESLEDQIYSDTAKHIKWPGDSIQLHRLVSIPATTEYPAPTAIVPISSRQSIFIDNNMGQIFRISYGNSGHYTVSLLHPKFELEEPIAMKRKDKHIFIADASHIIVTNSHVQQGDELRLFYTLHDFYPLDLHHFLVNPQFSYMNDAPLVVELGPNMQKVKTWGTQRDRAATGGIAGTAGIVKCGGVIIAAMRHAPLLLEFFANGEKKEIRLHAPGESSLLKLGHKPNLVHPRRGRYSLPRYTAAVACMKKTIYVLLELPVVCIYKINLSGKVVNIYHATAVHYGRHYNGLSVADYDGHLYIYTVAVNTSGARHIIIMRA